MNWYNHLYVGEKASRRRASVIGGIREGKLQPEVYVITPPAARHHILDIWPSAVLLLPPFCQRELLILGIAVTYREALEVTRQLIDDMYRQTGGFELERFLNQMDGGQERGLC